MHEKILVNLLTNTKKVNNILDYLIIFVLGIINSLYFYAEIQTMMGMLLYIPQGLDKSPYSDIIQDNMWEEVSELFTRDACTLLGLSFDSLLNVRY